MKTRFALLVLIAASVTPAEAQRWCFVNNEGGTDCSFGTVEQCRQTSSGRGGFCLPEAPVGHRQPTPGREMLPETASDKRLEQMNRRLDRQLNICKNC